MRIYLPATLRELADLTSGHQLAARLVHAVTPALRAELPEEDEEGLEYAAQLLAADDSLDLLDGEGPAGRRRLVVAADVPESLVEAAEGDEAHAPSVVRLTAALGRDAIACVHVDEADAEADVVAAREDDEEALERLAERDLLWFDVSELDRLVASARG